MCEREKEESVAGDCSRSIYLGRRDCGNSQVRSSAALIRGRTDNRRWVPSELLAHRGCGREQTKSQGEGSSHSLSISKQDNWRVL